MKQNIADVLDRNTGEAFLRTTNASIGAMETTAWI